MNLVAPVEIGIELGSTGGICRESIVESSARH